MSSQSGKNKLRRGKSRNLRRPLLLACILLVVSISACFLERSETASRSFRSMGTVATVTLGSRDASRIGPAAERIHEIFDRLDREMSSYRPDSAISRLARQAGAAPMAVPQDTYRVLSLSKHFGDVSDGAFDITVAPLVSLWGFNGSPAPDALPSEQDIRERQKLVGYRRLVLHNGTAFLPTKGMAADVGGIAKGYAVDRAYDACLAAGIHDFLIDFSGNMRASGSPAWGEKWEVGVRDPFDLSHLVGKIALPAGMALATSGSYERFVTIANQHFSHIIDPRTGYPVAGTASVTVLSPDAADADALSTSFFVVGLKGASKLLEKTPSTEVLIVPDRIPLELWLTPGFAKVFTPLPEFANTIKLIRASRNP